MKKRPGRFALVAEPLSCNVAFWFVPESCRGVYAERGHAGCYDELDSVTARIYNAMQVGGSCAWGPVLSTSTVCVTCVLELYKHPNPNSELFCNVNAKHIQTPTLNQAEGKMLVNFNPLSDHKLPRFFRIIINQPRVTTSDLNFVLDEIERLGAGLIALPGGVPAAVAADKVSERVH